MFICWLCKVSFLESLKDRHTCYPWLHASRIPGFYPSTRFIYTYILIETVSVAVSSHSHTVWMTKWGLTQGEWGIISLERRFPFVETRFIRQNRSGLLVVVLHYQFECEATFPWRMTSLLKVVSSSKKSLRKTRTTQGKNVSYPA